MKTSNWNKIASVTRSGKWFYRGTFGGTDYTVAQSFLTGLWNVSNNHNGLFAGASYKTATQAKRAVEKHYKD